MPTGSGTSVAQRGFTFLLMLFLVAAMGLLAAQAGVVWQMVGQREREAELLAIGTEMARALARYREETPAGMPSAPTSLQQLVEDRRFPVPRRHLRRIYRDPFTREADWGLERAGEGILGIHSLSGLSPIRRHDLPPEIESSRGAATYRDWVFRPVSSGPGGAAPAASPQSR